MYRLFLAPLTLLALLLSSAVLRAQELVPIERVVLGNPYSGLSIPVPPTVSMVSRNPLGFPISNAPVAVSFRATAGTDSIDDAGVKVCYSVDGGAPQCVSAALTSMNGDFSATIPGQAVGTMVTYWISVPDLGGITITFPSDTARHKLFYRVLDTPARIYDLQYTPNLLGTSGYVGYEATVTGVVTADTSDMTGDPAALGGAEPWVVIQDGGGPWSAIALRARGGDGLVIPGIGALRRGDSVTVTGIVAEDSGMTMLVNPSAVMNYGNVTVPSPYILSTDSVGQARDGETQMAEQWESVLICYGNVVVAQRNADAPAETNGEFFLSNAGTLSDQNTWTRVETDNSRTGYTARDASLGQTQISDGMHFDAIIGIHAYTSGNYKLIPRTFADYIVEMVGVNDGNAVAGLRAALAPNVVREVAVLEVGSDAPQILSVMIFDALGREVAVPAVDRRVEAGVTHIVIDAAALAPGTYRTVLRTSEGSLSVPMNVAR